MSDYPMLISNKLHSFRNFSVQIYENSSICRFLFGLFRVLKCDCGVRYGDILGKCQQDVS